jgi:DNA-directed RNA polymerase specialized sigma24 family protein
MDKVKWHAVSCLEPMTSVNPTPIAPLVERYYKSLFRFAAQLCGSPGQAMLLTQRAFQQAFRQNQGRPLPANARAWLCALLFQEFLESGSRTRRV